MNLRTKCLPLSLITLMSCSSTDATKNNELTSSFNTRAEHRIPSLQERRPVNKADRINGFMRGINLGNFLDSEKGKSWRQDQITNEYLSHVASLGFDHIRFPVRFSDYAQNEYPYKIDPSLLAKVDRIINLAYQNNLNVLLDLHHYVAIMSAPEKHKDRLLNIWKQLSNHYKSHDTNKLAFEILNEPTEQLTADVWNSIFPEIIEKIRVQNPDRLIVIGCTFWSNASHLNTLKLPPANSDPNIIASFHMYEPFIFTHQGASWVSPAIMVSQTGIVFPGPPESPTALPTIPEDLSWVSTWLEEYNTKPAFENPSGFKTIDQAFQEADKMIAKGYRVYMGEFGAIEFADTASRRLYLKTVREEAERRNIAWAYWDDGGAFKAVDLKNGDKTELISVLVGPKK